MKSETSLIADIVHAGKDFNRAVKEAAAKIEQYRDRKLTIKEANASCATRDRLREQLLDLIAQLGE